MTDAEIRKTVSKESPVQTRGAGTRPWRKRRDRAAAAVLRAAAAGPAVSLAAASAPAAGYAAVSAPNVRFYAGEGPDELRDRVPERNEERFGTYSADERQRDELEKKRSGTVFDKVLRIITLPMLMALALLMLLRLRAGMFPGPALAVGLAVLCVFPLLSYPFWLALPKLRKKGRKSQRVIACIFCFAGYAAGTAYCFAAGLGLREKVVFLTYLFSGTVIAVSAAFGIKISGHACGMSGPIFTLAWFVSPVYLAACVLLAAVFFSSIRLGRHSARELVLGTLLPVVVLALELSVLALAGIPVLR